jgi:hypothetical protein
MARPELVDAGFWELVKPPLADRTPQRTEGKEPSGAKERLERDADALSEHYAGMVPETLDSLTSKEHHGINNMLQPRVVVSADGPLEITDVFGRTLQACALRPVKTEAVSLQIPKVDRTPALGFRALLTEGGDPRVQLHRA